MPTRKKGASKKDASMDGAGSIMSTVSGPSNAEPPGSLGRQDATAGELEMDAHALEFLRDQYRHCKPILSVGSSAALLEKAGIPTTLPDGGKDHGLISSEDDSIAAALNKFKAALAAHRVFDRETDSPRV